MEQHQARLARVRRKMEEAGLSQLLITDHLSIYYLTGIDVVPMERFWALLVKGAGGEVLFANKLFALGETGLPTVTMTDTDDAAAMVAPHIVPGTMGVDKNMAARFLLPIMAACSETKVVLGSDCVDSVRACKDEAEKALMRRASEINDLCMEKLAAYLHDGATADALVDDRRGGAMLRLFAPLIHKMYCKYGQRGYKFSVSDECIRCSRCVESCPTHNIKLQDGKITFGKQCMTCLRCVSVCPVQAIDVNGKAGKNGILHLDRLIAKL